MQRRMRVITGAAEARVRSGVEAAYDHFRLERQGDLASPRTLEHYDYMFGQFLRWLEAERPQVRRVEDLDVAFYCGTIAARNDPRRRMTT